MTKTSKYANVSDARAQQGANYVRPGHYLFLIRGVEEGEAFKKGDYIAIRLQTLAALPDSTPGRDYNRGIDLALHSVGEETAEICMLSNVAFEGRIKAFAMIAGDLTEEDFAQESYKGATIDALVGESQPVAGVVVEARAETVVKKVSRSKRDEDLTNDDVYTRITYVRRVPFADLSDLVGEDVTSRYIPDLDEKIAEETGVEVEAEAEATE